MSVNLATSEKRANPADVDHTPYKRSRLHYIRMDKLIAESSIDNIRSDSNLHAREVTGQVALGILPANNVERSTDASRGRRQYKIGSQSGHQISNNGTNSSKNHLNKRIQEEVALLRRMASISIKQSPNAY